jgi:hypothetical protein
MPRLQMSVITEGYRPEFKVEPGAYHEKNYGSAFIHSTAVTEKLAKWPTEGYVKEVN